MAYKLTAEQAKRLGRSSETLLNLLSTNTGALRDLGVSVKEKFLHQSFMAAGSIFETIDAPADGIVVPYGAEGQRLVDGLLQSDADPNRQRELVRKAQRYTVNVFPQTMARLEQAHAVREISASTRIRLLADARFYDPQVGLTTEVDDE
jgi:CRISPR-associated endonuclease/helicase Cas3